MHYSLITLTALLAHAAGAHGAIMQLFYPWNASDWVNADDTAGDGTSNSTLDVIPAGSPGNTLTDTAMARFHGMSHFEPYVNGSMYVSQRTADNWGPVDLSRYDRFILEVPYSDHHRFTVILKDTVLPPVDGVEQETTSWECHFSLARRTADKTPANDYREVEILFSDLIPKVKFEEIYDTEPLNLKSIKRFQLLMRTNFGGDPQEGWFELGVKSIMVADNPRAYAKAAA